MARENEQVEKEEEIMNAAVHMGPSHRPPIDRAALDLAFRFGTSRMLGREVVFAVIALGAHVGLALGYHPEPRAVALPPRVTEVELAPPPPPAPLPEPVPEKEAAMDKPVVPARAASVAPQAARAGALITAKEAAPSAKADELVDFVTDPNGTSYGSGVVARGGTADHGARGATAAGTGTAPVTAPAPAPASTLTPASNLSRRATLSEPNACAGFYPSEANTDAGSVTINLVVRADGSVSSASVVSETPAGQGFGKAARTCLQRKRFEPSLDRSGNPVDAATTIRLRFVR
jgi:TonB family protein